MEKCKLKLSLEEKKSTKIRRCTEFHIDNPGETNSFRSITMNSSLSSPKRKLSSKGRGRPSKVSKTSPEKTKLPMSPTHTGPKFL